MSNFSGESFNSNILLTQESSTCLQDELKTVYECFINTIGYIKFKKDSFEKAVEQTIPNNLLESYGTKQWLSSNGEYKFSLQFTKCRVKMPSKENYDLFPYECTVRGLHYYLLMVSDVVFKVYVKRPKNINVILLDEQCATCATESLNNEWILLKCQQYVDIPICEIPNMVKSAYCHLTQTKTFGNDCPLSYGGHYIINGISKYIVNQMSRRAHYPFIQAPCEKTHGKYECEYRTIIEHLNRPGNSMHLFVSNMDEMLVKNGNSNNLSSIEDLEEHNVFGRSQTSFISENLVSEHEYMMNLKNTLCKKFENLDDNLSDELNNNTLLNNLFSNMNDLSVPQIYVTLSGISTQLMFNMTTIFFLFGMNSYVDIFNILSEGIFDCNVLDMISNILYQYSSPSNCIATPSEIKTYRNLAKTLLADKNVDNANRLNKLLKSAFFMNENYSKKLNVFDMTRLELILFISANLMSKQQDTLTQLEYTAYKLNHEFLMHMGTDDSQTTHKNKCLLFAHIVKKLILTSMCKIRPDDEDHFNVKRIKSDGALMADLFRSLFQKLLKDVKSAIRKTFDTSMSSLLKAIPYGSVHNIRDYETWRAFLHSIPEFSIHESLLLFNKCNIYRAMATGTWTTNHSTSSGSTGVAQIHNPMTIMSNLSHLRQVSNNAVQQECKLTRPRELHSSVMYHICPGQTPDSEKLGLITNLALGTQIRTGYSISTILPIIASVNIAWSHLSNVFVPTHKTFEQAELQYIRHTGVPIMCNGALVGYTTCPHSFMSYMQLCKRTRDIAQDIGISWVNGPCYVGGPLRDSNHHYISISGDSGATGQYCISLLHVWKLPILYKQYESQRDLHGNIVSLNSQDFWNILIDHGVIEYVDVEQEPMLQIADTLEKALVDISNNILQKHDSIYMSSASTVCVSNKPDFNSYTSMGIECSKNIQESVKKLHLFDIHKYLKSDPKHAENVNNIIDANPNLPHWLREILVPNNNHFIFTKEYYEHEPNISTPAEDHLNNNEFIDIIFRRLLYLIQCNCANININTCNLLHCKLEDGSTIKGDYNIPPTILFYYLYCIKNVDFQCNIDMAIQCGIDISKYKVQNFAIHNMPLEMIFKTWDTCGQNFNNNNSSSSNNKFTSKPSTDAWCSSKAWLYTSSTYPETRYWLDYKGPITHCRIDPSFMYAINVNSIIGPNHTNAARVQFAAAMNNQMTALWHLNGKYRFDKLDQHMVDSTQPLVDTQLVRMIQPNGIGHGGRVLNVGISGDPYNIEDGSVQSRFINDMGMGRSWSIHGIKLDIPVQNGKSLVHIEKPNLYTCLGRKNANYKTISADGFPMLGVVIKMGDIIVGRTIDTDQILPQELIDQAAKHENESTEQPQNKQDITIDNTQSNNNDNDNINNITSNTDSTTHMIIKSINNNTSSKKRKNTSAIMIKTHEQLEKYLSKNEYPSFYKSQSLPTLDDLAKLITNKNIDSGLQKAIIDFLCIATAHIVDSYISDLSKHVKNQTEAANLLPGGVNSLNTSETCLFEREGESHHSYLNELFKQYEKLHDDTDQLSPVNIGKKYVYHILSLFENQQTISVEKLNNMISTATELLTRFDVALKSQYILNKKNNTTTTKKHSKKNMQTQIQVGADDQQILSTQESGKKKQKNNSNVNSTSTTTTTTPPPSTSAQLSEQTIMAPGKGIAAKSIILYRLLTAIKKQAMTLKVAKRDNSIISKSPYPQMITTIVTTKSGSGNTLIRLKSRTYRIVEIADKFTSAHAQKGVIGNLCPVTDMIYQICPFTGRGIPIDALMNPHAIPSRMTLGQYQESHRGLAAIWLSGNRQDGTPFSSLDFKKLPKEMYKRGHSYDLTKCSIDASSYFTHKRGVSALPIAIMRLKHMARDKHNIRAAEGPESIKTRQPTEGKSKQGGLKSGNMEGDVFSAHGTTEIARQTRHYASDPFHIIFCILCGYIAEAPPNPNNTLKLPIKSSIGAYCRACNRFDCIVFSENPYSVFLVFLEMYAQGSPWRLSVDDNIAQNILGKNFKSQILRARNFDGHKNTLSTTQKNGVLPRPMCDSNSGKILTIPFSTGNSSRVLKTLLDYIIRPIHKKFAPFYFAEYDIVEELEQNVYELDNRDLTINEADISIDQTTTRHDSRDTKSLQTTGHMDGLDSLEHDLQSYIESSRNTSFSTLKASFTPSYASLSTSPNLSLVGSQRIDVCDVFGFDHTRLSYNNNTNNMFVYDSSINLSEDVHKSRSKKRKLN